MSLLPKVSTCREACASPDRFVVADLAVQVVLVPDPMDSAVAEVPDLMVPVAVGASTVALSQVDRPQMACPPKPWRRGEAGFNACSVLLAADR